MTPKDRENEPNREKQDLALEGLAHARELACFKIFNYFKLIQRSLPSESFLLLIFVVEDEGPCDFLVADQLVLLEVDQVHLGNLSVDPFEFNFISEPLILGLGLNGDLVADLLFICQSASHHQVNAFSFVALGIQNLVPANLYSFDIVLDLLEPVGRYFAEEIIFFEDGHPSLHVLHVRLL